MTLPDEPGDEMVTDESSGPGDEDLHFFVASLKEIFIFYPSCYVFRVTEPTISVIVPTYRRTTLLLRALESIRKQVLQPSEIIVVGDGCPDLPLLIDSATPPPILFDPIVRVMNLQSNTHDGGATPRNRGIEAALGSHIAYLDDDNAWLPDHLSSIWKAMQEKPATWGFSSKMVVDFESLRPKIYDFPRLGVDTSAVIHPRNFYGKYGPWKSASDPSAGKRWQEGIYAHDWDLFERYVKAGEPWAATKKLTLLYTSPNMRKSS